jgi:hypothetical protein
MSGVVRRTADVELDQDFDVVCDVAKASIDTVTGERYVRGLASGVLEDRDGERVSKNALAGMARQSTAGGQIKLMAASHIEDWVNEIGDVVKVEHDPDNDELWVTAKLPPEGVDPLADKAWRKLTIEKKQLGFSIGGKLKKAFYELAERGGEIVKRKVLDGISLRHVTLTARPSYAPSFAEAIAKTWDGEPPADEEFEEIVEVEIAKAADRRPDPEEPVAPASGSEEEQGTDAPPAPAGEQDANQDGEISDAEAAKDLPQGKGARHLACPECGHEFAAPLSEDLADNRSDAPNPESDDDEDTKKMAETTTTSSLDEALARVREVADLSVEKTEPETTEVEKTEVEVTDVEKQIAAVHQEGEAVMAEAIPQGRKSVARVTPGAPEPPRRQDRDRDRLRAGPTSR